MTKLITRYCPICEAKEYNTIYEQRFYNILGIDIKEFLQTLVSCKKCGMAYIQKFLNNEALKKFYSFMSNYEFENNNFEFTDDFKELAKRQYEYLRKELDFNKINSILDIGCSNGYTLSLFLKDNIEVLGVEPSQKLKKVAKEKYNINVITKFFNKNIDIDKKFNLIILSHIVEHLMYPSEFIKSLRKNLSQNDFVFIEVPTISEFTKDCMFHISFEHVNYFNLNSLKNLMILNGFELQNKIIFKNQSNCAPDYPTLGTIWKKKNIFSHKIQYASTDHLQNYIFELNNYKKQIGTKIEKIKNRNIRIAIWGAGTITAQLFANTKISQCNISFIFDNNSKKNSQKMANIIIKTPKYKNGQLIVEDIDAIIIGSWSSQTEIYENLLNSTSGLDIIKLFK